VPHFCFTIALCHGGEPVVGLTLQPLLNEEFAAVRGAGCTLNGAPVRAAETDSVKNAVIGIDLGYDDQRGRRQLELAQYLWPVQALRIPGSAALGVAYAAVGRWDLFVHSDLQPWDVAAGLLLVREAGGTVTDREGNPASIFNRSLVAGAPQVHADFFALAGHLPWRA
jgi:fructose-1,6-bisphosphatase/inositol monophosphatase family enzyme